MLTLESASGRPFLRPVIGLEITNLRSSTSQPDPQSGNPPTPKESTSSIRVLSSPGVPCFVNNELAFTKNSGSSRSPSKTYLASKLSPKAKALEFISI